ncbi:hypothetical protein PCANB_000662 [Pneumocystis canis]|nr:hypothetical protein PCK1_000709 [Pneumocystis canis]KAG5437625.1 hypothetical protein PCANB_000662 [Pneumocystis canis]
MDLWKTCPEISCSQEIRTILDRARLSTLDLLTVDSLEISKKTSIAVTEIEALIYKIIQASIPKESRPFESKEPRFLTTGDKTIDHFLSGGIPVGHVLEIAGESGTGKSQFCLQLCLTTQLPRTLGGLEKEAIYISTEMGLSTKRLFQIAEGLSNRLKNQYPNVNICLDGLGDRVHCVTCADLEEQDHIVYFQLPVVLERYRAGIVILDSITTHYRAEYDTSKAYHSSTLTNNTTNVNLMDLVNRSRDLVRLGAHLRLLANKYNCAIVVINQVSDKIKRDIESFWDLNYQGAWFQGWNHDEYPCKVPSLGFVWSNNIHSRILLLRSAFYPIENMLSSSRILRIVFSPFCAPAEINIDIKYEGLIARICEHRKIAELTMSTVYKSHIRKNLKKQARVHFEDHSDTELDIEDKTEFKKKEVSKFKEIRQKVLVLSSRGVTFRQE